MQNCIEKVCNEVRDMLLAKNKSYGNSAADPIRIFSKVSSVDQINIRIDDKLSRIARGNEFDGDDTELDLIGYLILKRCVKKLERDIDDNTNDNKPDILDARSKHRPH